MDEIDRWAYRDHTEEEMEAFKLWYEFLKLSNKELWTEKVREYFGDVTIGFNEWWEDHSYLFDLPTLPTIDEVQNTNEFEAFLEARPSEGDPGIVVIALWLNKSKKELREAFEEILYKYHLGNRGRQEYETYGEFFQFAYRPDAKMLEKILKVYRMYIDNQTHTEAKKLKLWEIEEKIGLIDKTSDKAEWIWRDKTMGHLESQRRSQHTTVRKYINYAEKILDNVVKGDFPVYKD